MQITKHAKERYAERIMDKTDLRDMNLFITQNEDKIKTDIEKMIQYGTRLYTGKTSCGKAGSNPVNVYQKDLWIVLEDSKTHDVITLYKIDLGLDDDFNRIFVTKMLDKLKQAYEEKEKIQDSINHDCEEYRQLIKDNESSINMYKGLIKELEALNTGYKTVIEDLQVKNAIADQNIREVVAKLIGKKDF